MNWSARYIHQAGFGKDFKNLVNSTVQQEADERISYHQDRMDEHESALKDYDEHHYLHTLHTLAYNAHSLAHEAWNHVWNNVETPYENKEYNAKFEHSLRKHARDLSPHADNISELTDEN